MTIISKFNNKLVEEFENVILSDKKTNRIAIERNKSICSFTLLYKSYLLYKNLIDLLERHQFQPGAYLTRGILESRADMVFILNSDEKVAKYFMDTANIVRKARNVLRIDGNAILQRDEIKKWTNNVSIMERIAKLGKNEKFSYDLLCAYAHSSTVAIDDIHRKEENLIVKEQLLIATHNFLESIIKYLDYFKINKDCFSISIKDFIEAYK